MRKINLLRFSPLLVLVLPLQIDGAADPLPKPFTFARYQPMMDRSPFAVATAIAAPVAAPNFAKDLYVANAAKSKEGDMVTIASITDKAFKKYLTTVAPVDGYSITNIEWSEKIGGTKVTIAKDGQTATLGFNEALLAGPASAQNPMAGQNPVPAPNLVAPPPNQIPPQREAQDKSAALAQPPGMQPPGMPPSNPKAMPVPMLPTPPPRVRGIIPRNPQAPAMQQQQKPQPQAQPHPQLQQKPNS